MPGEKRTITTNRTKLELKLDAINADILAILTTNRTKLELKQAWHIKNKIPMSTTNRTKLELKRRTVSGR